MPTCIFLKDSSLPTAKKGVDILLTAIDLTVPHIEAAFAADDAPTVSFVEVGQKPEYVFNNPFQLPLLMLMNWTDGGSAITYSAQSGT